MHGAWPKRKMPRTAIRATRKAERGKGSGRYLLTLRVNKQRPDPLSRRSRLSRGRGRGWSRRRRCNRLVDWLLLLLQQTLLGLAPLPFHGVVPDFFPPALDHLVEARALVRGQHRGNLILKILDQKFGAMSRLVPQPPQFFRGLHHNRAELLALRLGEIELIGETAHQLGSELLRRRKRLLPLLLLKPQPLELEHLLTEHLSLLRRLLALHLMLVLAAVHLLVHDPHRQDSAADGAGEVDAHKGENDECRSSHRLAGCQDTMSTMSETGSSEAGEAAGAAAEGAAGAIDGDALAATGSGRDTALITAGTPAAVAATASTEA